MAPPPFSAAPVRNQAARLKRLPRHLIKQAALGAVRFIVSRPQLDDFLRRQIYRFPGIAGQIRAAVAYSRRSDWQSLPPVLSDEAELSADAHQVLRDLIRVADRTRTP